MQRLSSTRAPGRLQANNSVYLFLLLYQLGYLIGRASGIALGINYLCQLDCGEIFQSVRHTRYPVVKIALPLNRDHRDVSVVSKERGHLLEALSTCPEIVRPDVQHAFRIRDI